VTPRRLQTILRRGTLIVAAIAGVYLWSRYEVIPLPAEGCSPLQRLSPGNLLWVDRYPSSVIVGDVLFFEQADGSVGLGEVARLEAAPERYWIVTDDDACPAPDSDDFGWVAPDAVYGRLLLAMDL